MFENSCLNEFSAFGKRQNGRSEKFKPDPYNCETRITLNKKEVKNLEELKQISCNLAADLKIPQIVLLSGGLAVGKTQMVQYMAQALGLKETVHSPTFSIINLYKKNPQIGIYHVDLYRIKTEEELEDIAFWDIFCEPTIIFIEWPRIVGKKLPRLWNKLFIQIKFSKKASERFVKWDNKPSILINR